MKYCSYGGLGVILSYYSTILCFCLYLSFPHTHISIISIIFSPSLYLHPLHKARVIADAKLSAVSQGILSKEQLDPSFSPQRAVAEDGEPYRVKAAGDPSSAPSFTKSRLTQTDDATHSNHHRGDGLSSLPDEDLSFMIQLGEKFKDDPFSRAYIDELIQSRGIQSPTSSPQPSSPTPTPTPSSPSRDMPKK